MSERRRYSLPMVSSEYILELPEHGRWAEHVGWGPAGTVAGRSSLGSGGDILLTGADSAPVEYLPFGMSPFREPDLIGSASGEQRGFWWRFDLAEPTYSPGELRLAFLDDRAGLRVVLCYQTVADTDVLLRWAELSNVGDTPVDIERMDSAGFVLPVGPTGARLVYLAGQWAHEFQLQSLTLAAGRFSIGSTRGMASHSFSPWLAVQAAGQSAAVARSTWGVALAWPGSWHIDADIELTGPLRVRAGRTLHESSFKLAPGRTVITPAAAAAYSHGGLDGLASTWHAYERRLTRHPGRPRKIVYNSWEATSFAVEEQSQLELARIAAEVGVEVFVVDDGWFCGRVDDTGGLGDWTPDLDAFPSGFDVFVERVRALGLDFGLWIEPEAVSPNSTLYAQHPEWVYRMDGREPTLIRNELLLDLGREDVFRFVVDTFDRLLSSYPISYVKWDLNRPPTERGRPGDTLVTELDLDGSHARNYLRVLDHLRDRFPHVAIEGCAGGGARVELATIARTDVVWPSDNTAPLDRLAIQHGFLHAHGPHVMGSWVSDAVGVLDTRPRSLKFRFLTAMAGVLGIGADIRHWTADELKEAAGYIALYKELRSTIHFGTVHILGTPKDPVYAVEYIADGGREVAVLIWSTGRLSGTSFPGTSSIILRDLPSDTEYADTRSGSVYTSKYLHTHGLPIALSANDDCDIVRLHRR